MMYTSDVEARTENFSSYLRGAMFETLTGAGDYHVPFGLWYIPIADKVGTLLYRENLNTYLTQAGNLQLHSNGAIDIFHAQEVRATDQEFLHDELNPYPHQGWQDSLFWTQGRKHIVHETHLTLVSPVLFGMYQDDYNRILDQDTDYELTIYIHYITEEQL